MSSSDHPSRADALRAAAHELKRRRTAEAAVDKPPGKIGKKAKADKAATVRCTLRLPASEYQKLAKLRKRLAREGVRSNRAKLVRAGLTLLVGLQRSDLKAAIRDVIAPEPATDETSAPAD